MRRLNVRLSQIEECIAKSLFAVDALPRAHPLKRGEELLLQLTLEDARRVGREHTRIEFALIFEKIIEDENGDFSREHWPLAGKTWKHILVCSETIPTLPFSLEDLTLRHDYSGIANAVHIDPHDEAVIRPYLKSELRFDSTVDFTDVRGLLGMIKSHDKIRTLRPEQRTSVAAHERLLHDPWLGNALKTLYSHKCQICTHDFEPRYSVPYADTRLIRPPQKGQGPLSNSIVVLCPNHNAIISATKARFEEKALAFEYPNGLTERLLLRDHLLAG